MIEGNSLPRTEPVSPVRKLTIEAVGDFRKGQAKSKIRLIGRWLERAGFRPGSRVHVTCVAPGFIELRSSDPEAVGVTTQSISEEPKRSF